MSYEQANVVSLMIGPVYDTRMGPSEGFFRLFASSKKSIAEEIGDFYFNIILSRKIIKKSFGTSFPFIITTFR